MMKWHWNHKKTKKMTYTSHHIGSVFSHEMVRYCHSANRRQPTYSAAELDLMLWLTQILKRNIHALPCKRSERKHSRHSITFLCLPLNTTAKAPCPTRSFLLYSKSPTVSIAMRWWSRTDGRLQNVALTQKCCSFSSGAGWCCTLCCRFISW